MVDQELREAYVLHMRKYRDTSLIVELLTRDEGRVAVVMRGARGKRSKISGELRPFRRFLVAYFGRGELKTVRNTDFPVNGVELSGDALLLGLYINELLVRVAGKFEPLPEVFAEYGRLITDIAGEGPPHVALRRFELTLLSEMGYGITFECDAESGEHVSPAGLYRYVPDEGFHEVREPGADAYVFKGEHLLAISVGDLASPEVDASAKRIIRASMAPLLGDRPLKSRELFRRIEELT